MSTADLVMWVVVAAIFPIWISIIAVIIVAPPLFIYYIWSIWIQLVKDLWRDIKGKKHE